VILSCGHPHAYFNPCDLFFVETPLRFNRDHGGLVVSFVKRVVDREGLRRFVEEKGVNVESEMRPMGRD